MIRGEKSRRKAGRIGFHNFQAAGIQFTKTSFTGDYMERGALLRARFGPKKRATWKIERREAARRRNLHAASTPMEAAGNH